MSDRIDAGDTLSPLQRLYHKAITSPHTINRVERNQIHGRPIPSEEDALCLAATSYNFHDLVQKAIKEPSALTDTEARILSDGANQPSRADIDKTIAGFKAMSREERDLMDEAWEASADPEETKAKTNAWDVIVKKRAEKRAISRQQREAARGAPGQTSDIVQQKKAWVKMLEQKGWTEWGFVCFRTYYGEDAAWTRAKERVKAITTAALAPVSATAAVKQTWKIVYVEDEMLQGIAAEGLRERFKSLVEAGSVTEGIRTDYFISADATVVRSFQAGRNSAIIPVWEAGFNPRESHSFGYPGAVAVPCSLLLATVYPMMLMGEPTPLQTLHFMAGG